MNIQKKNFLWNMIGASTNAFNSLFFVIAATRINGVEQAGIFSFAFATACIFYVIGTYVVRPFQVTDYSGRFSDTDYIYNRIITCLLMLAATAVFVGIKGYDGQKLRVILLLCGFKALEAFSEILYGIVQKREKLYQAGISMTVKAIAGLAAFVSIDYFTKNLSAACAGVAVVNLLVILLYDFPNVRASELIITKFSARHNGRLFAVGFFTFALTILTNYLINAPRYAIDDMIDSGMQTVYGIIILPATFMALLGQYLIQPVLTKISGYMMTRNYAALRRIISFILILMLLLGAVVFVVAFLLEEPVLSLLYGINLKPYRNDMLIIIAGAILYGIEIVVSYILISFRKTAVQAVICAVCAGSATVLSYRLVAKQAIRGASLTYLLSMSLLALLLCGCLFYFLKKYKRSWEKSGEDVV